MAAKADADVTDVPAKEGLNYFKDSGFSQSSIDRARKRVGIGSFHDKDLAGGWVWRYEDTTKTPKNPALGDPTSSTSSGPEVTSSVACVDCGNPLDPALVRASMSAHPNCDPAGAA